MAVDPLAEKPGTVLAEILLHTLDISTMTTLTVAGDQVITLRRDGATINVLLPDVGVVLGLWNSHREKLIEMHSALNDSLRSIGATMQFCIDDKVVALLGAGAQPGALGTIAGIEGLELRPIGMIRSLLGG